MKIRPLLQTSTFDRFLVDSREHLAGSKMFLQEGVFDNASISSLLGLACLFGNVISLSRIKPMRNTRVLFWIMGETKFVK